VCVCICHIDGTPLIAPCACVCVCVCVLVRLTVIVCVCVPPWWHPTGVKGLRTYLKEYTLKTTPAVRKLWPFVPTIHTRNPSFSTLHVCRSAQIYAITAHKYARTNHHYAELWPPPYCLEYAQRLEHEICLGYGLNNTGHSDAWYWRRVFLAIKEDIVIPHIAAYLRMQSAYRGSSRVCIIHRAHSDALHHIYIYMYIYIY